MFENYCFGKMRWLHSKLLCLKSALYHLLSHRNLITNLLRAHLSRLAYVELYKTQMRRESNLTHCHFGQKHHSEIYFPETWVQLLTW